MAVLQVMCLDCREELGYIYNVPRTQISDYAEIMRTRWEGHCAPRIWEEEAHLQYASLYPYSLKL